MLSLERITKPFLRPTTAGTYFEVHSWKAGSNIGYSLISGSLTADPVPVRIQSPCLFGESFGVNSCDCAAQLGIAVRRAVDAKDNGGFLIVYPLSDEGRGHGHLVKTLAIEKEVNDGLEMTESYDELSLEPDLRDYEMAAAIIHQHVGNRPLQLHTNNPKKVDALSKMGLLVADRVPIIVENPNQECRKYLNNKREKMGHILSYFEESRGGA